MDRFALVLAFVPACAQAVDPPPDLRPATRVDELAQHCPPKDAAPEFVVHEWGTFTAVAGLDGSLRDWRPLLGPSDLPSFVHTIGQQPDKHEGKATIVAPIRMETPVIYFYGGDQPTADVSISFPRGAITEWFPKARVVDADRLDFGTVQLLPDVPGSTLPHDGSESHYYPARTPDALAVEVDGERDRFLFYRGVGWFDLPLRAAALEDGVRLIPAANAPHSAILFARDGDRLGFATVDIADREVPRPALDDELDDVLAALDETLTAEGLTPAEADAMIETWRDHWFEPGLRLFFVMPRPQVDTLLPLSIDPPPGELVRTIVGRVELLTPQDVEEVRSLAADRRADLDAVTVRIGAEHVRFAEPLAREARLGADAVTSDRLSTVLYGLERQASL